MRTDREKLHYYGCETVRSLVLKGVSPRVYLTKPGEIGGPMTTTDENRADYWLTDLDASQAKKTAEWLSGVPLEVVERPALIGFSDNEIDEAAFDAAAHDVRVSDRKFDRFVNEILSGENGDALAARVLKDDYEFLTGEPLGGYAVRTPQGAIRLEG